VTVGYLKNNIKEVSVWSYEHTDKQCNKALAFSREFYGFTHPRIRMWEKFSNSDIEQLSSDLKKFISTSKKSKSNVKGRGVVYSSSSKSLRMVSISIKFIRSYGCDLPIEVWYRLLMQA
jgi:hypothetical protein